mgnify:CR=1 FL=1
MRIAVVGSGLDVVYPPRHRALWQRVADHGLLLTEGHIALQAESHPIEFRNDAGGNIHSVVGKVSFDKQKLIDNINAMIGNLRKTTDRNTEQDWLKTNLAKFSRMMQGQRDLTTVAQMLLSAGANIRATSRLGGGRGTSVRGLVQGALLGRRDFFLLGRRRRRGTGAGWRSWRMTRRRARTGSWRATSRRSPAGRARADVAQPRRRHAHRFGRCRGKRTPCRLGAGGARRSGARSPGSSAGDRPRG